MAEGTTKHVIPAGGKLFEVRSGSEGFMVDEEIPKGVGRVGLESNAKPVGMKYLRMLTVVLKESNEDKCASGNLRGGLLVV
ncbi:hypothetical protein Tco_0204548 [Tanacetum coccineum]